MSCHAPNDKLIEGLADTVEVYYCELEFGHKGPHKCSGYPVWWSSAQQEANYYAEKERVAKKWRAAALEDALPDDAAEVADRLVPMEYWARREYDDMTEADTLARAIAILRGEP